MRINLHRVENFTKAEVSKLERSLNLLESYINSDSFKQYILNFKYLGKLQFANNAGLSNEEIYNLIMSGKEVLSPTKDSVWDLSISIYNTYIRGRNIIGYTYPNTPVQYINRRFFSSFNIAQIGGNVAHEYCHKLGLDHDFKATARRPYSVPYVVGNVVAGEAMTFLEHRGI
jgi:hypothetical protein